MLHGFFLRMPYKLDLSVRFNTMTVVTLQTSCVNVCVCVCVQIREILADNMREVVEKVTGNQLKAEEVLNERAELSQHECYMTAVDYYKHNCFNWHRTEVEIKKRKIPPAHFHQPGVFLLGFIRVG